MVKIMDIRSFSKEPGRYLKKVKNNDMVQALRSIEPRCSWDDKTLSKKGRGVKMLELRSLGLREKFSEGTSGDIGEKVISLFNQSSS